MVDSGFASASDACFKSPSSQSCKNGTTVSVFYKLEFEVNQADLETNFAKTFPRETILSSGGDYGVPGLQIYRDGPILGAIFSTGADTWEVKVMGNLPKNNSWTNIAVRWEPLKFTNEAEYREAKAAHNDDLSKLGGIQLLINLEMIGHSLLPMDECPQNSYTSCTSTNQIEHDPSVDKAISEATMMIGCHKTARSAALRQFSGGTFDEVAYWNRRIPDEERHMLLGGWKESFDQV